MVDFMTWEEENGHSFKKEKLKYIVSTPITDGPHETPELLDEGIPFLSAESVKNGILDFNYKRGYISLSDHKLFCKKVRPQKNDIFIVKSGATTGNCGIVTTDEEFSIWSPLALIRCDNISVLQKFIYYYSLCYSFTHQVEQSWSYGTQQNIGMGVLGNLYVTLPSSNEQQSIVDYLDKECAQIDSIAADLEKQIALLQQYKKSLITETVTKGLDKSVPMKDSGVEWIGEIPEHWEISRVRHLASLCSGATPSKDVFSYWEGNIPWVSSQEVKSDIIKDTSLHISEEAINSCSTQLMPAGTLVMVVRSGILQHTIPVALLGVPATINQDIKAFQFNHLMLPAYFKYYIQGENDALLSVIIKDKTTVESVDNQLLLSLKIMVPPIEEQKAIVAFLNYKCGYIDKILNDKQEQLNLLMQHKKSLIYEYVTGKKRVKEVQ